jgi:hypothetical protein
MASGKAGAVHVRFTLFSIQLICMFAIGAAAAAAMIG